jgi:cytoskeletal protein RodZ
MMLCPACNRVYDQNQKFCEEDGTQLVSVPSVIVGGGNTGQVAPAQPNWASGAVGVVIGLTIAVGAVGIYSVLTHNSETQQTTREQTAKVTTASANQPVRAVAYKPIETSTPEEEEEAEPSPEPSPTPSPTPVPSPTAPPSSVGASPISTNVTKSGSGSAKISFNDGSVIEADDAWEDAKGVWYRRGSLVTFIERERINNIERLTMAQRQAPEAKLTP